MRSPTLIELARWQVAVTVASARRGGAGADAAAIAVTLVRFRAAGRHPEMEQSA
jgi:hypothetical protein